ncbi:PIN domain-containing protein [Trebonia sp.]|uniref:type II toxin-antitoxin system VapC family toxin n=1 Tax=Trebonia sp. TaxID=2767075 RepID=UPI00260D1408|nr:PIN domain-containing protein [Trebonia sp.]
MTLLLDTGPLVAAIVRSDKHHARCAALLESAAGPLLIPTTVIVEVCWLLEERPDIEAALLTSVATGEFQHVTITAADLARTAELVRTYAGLPLGAAGASVIAVAERLHVTDVATLDRRHFTVVRRKHHAALNLLP